MFKKFEEQGCTRAADEVEASFKTFYILLIMCTVVDICDRAAAADIFPPGWSANKRVGKVTRLSYPIVDNEAPLAFSCRASAVSS